MATVASSDCSTATASHQDRLNQMVDSVLAAADKQDCLHRLLIDIDADGNPRLACDLFESLIWRMEVNYYWIYYRVMRNYTLLRRFDAAYLLAVLSSKLDPTSSGAVIVSQTLFYHFMRSGRRRDALAVFERHNDIRPEHPFVSAVEVGPLLSEFGATLPGQNVAGAAGPARRQDVCVVPASVRNSFSCQIYGRFTPAVFVDLRKPRDRSPINVALLEDAQILLNQDFFVVVDANGQVHEDLSVHEFPSVLYKSFQAHPDPEIEEISLADSVVTSDRFPVVNLAHNLLDHMTRLELYRRAGADVPAATVVGTELRADFQKRLAEKFGIRNYLSTNRKARISVRRLWVSSNCRDLRHPGHEGMAWAMQFVRERLGAATTPGPRKLYISRSDARVRRVSNEPEVAALLKEHGFTVIVPGNMPYDEQIAAFTNACCVVGAHGAGLCHIVLCAPGTQILEIFHPLYTPPGLTSLAFETGLNYSALISYDGNDPSPEFNDPGRVDGHVSYLTRDIRVDLDELRRWLHESGVA